MFLLQFRSASDATATRSRMAVKYLRQQLSEIASCAYFLRLNYSIFMAVKGRYRRKNRPESFFSGLGMKVPIEPY